jgi:hypothetical protein
MGNLSKEIESLCKQRRYKEMPNKYFITEKYKTKNNSIHGFNRHLEKTEGIISQTEKGILEFSQSEQLRKKLIDL